jgi:hypothetical protein
MFNRTTLEDQFDRSPETFEVSSTLEVRRLWDLLTGAFEGGSNYWIGRVEVVGDRPTGTYFIQDVPFLGGELRVVLENPEDVEGDHILTKDQMIAGFQLMQRKYPLHAFDVIRENDDAVTADVFLQMTLFGEIVYG